MAENEDLLILDSSDPLNLIINNPAMDDAEHTSDHPDWSQLGALWPEEAAPAANQKQFSDYLDFNMASEMLDMDLDMALTGATTASGIEPSALHLGVSEERLGYPTYDDPFAFPASASPADILAAQFPLSFLGGDSLMESSSIGLETPNIKQRRLSITSSSSSSGPSFSPVPESIPSPGNGYTSDSTHNSSAASFSSSEVSVDPPATTARLQSPSSPPTTLSKGEFSNDPAAELAQRVRQSAGVLLAVPMNNGGTPYQAGQLFPTASALQTKLPIPRLQRPNTASPPKSTTPSATSSAASTPPPSTPTSGPTDSPTSAPASITSIGQPPNAARPKTSHTTIERRYRTNLNARIQSLRMAVPALRVLEDRDAGSSKKIKKNLKTGILIKTSSGSSPHSITTTGGGTALAAFTGSGGALNSYGEVDVIDERGYVDGVKVARKCSKANVLGKAVEYIGVLKRREMRLRNEQDGLKALVCGLVGGPALLREWEKEWKERFGGEERDEVPLDGDADEDGDDEDDDEDDDEEGEGAGKKRKRPKVEKDILPLPKKDSKPITTTLMTVDGQPEKRKRGRPRKTPHPPAPSPHHQHTVPTATPIQPQPQPQPQQQYLLAVFALFSFFNSPLTSSSTSHHAARHGHGHVLSPPPVPLAYAPEIVSQFEASTDSSFTWRDWVQIVHLVLTIALLVSVVARMRGGFGLDRLRKFIKSTDSSEIGDEKKVEMIILGKGIPPSFTSALALYRSLPSTTSTITRALYLYTLASSTSTPILLKPVLRMRARALWSSSSPVTDDKKHKVIISSSIEDVYTTLPNVTTNKQTSLIDSIAECLIKRKLGEVLGKWFVCEVSKSGKDKEADEESTSTTLIVAEDLDLVFEVAKDLGGDVGLLARNVERVRAGREESVPTSTTTTATTTKPPAPVVWKAVISGDDVNEEEEESDDSDYSSLSSSIESLGEDEDEDEDEAQVPSTLLRALVLYRSLFSSSSPTTIGLGLGLLTSPPSQQQPPTISIEPPTPTTPLTPVRRRVVTSSTKSSALPSTATTTTTTGATSIEQRKKMYTLRKLLGNRIFEHRGEAMEDARDKVVDMLVDAERRCVRC